MAKRQLPICPACKVGRLWQDTESSAARSCRNCGAIVEAADTETEMATATNEHG